MLYSRLRIVEWIVPSMDASLNDCVSDLTMIVAAGV
jgi:hypothetical protein